MHLYRIVKKGQVVVKTPRFGPFSKVICVIDFIPGHWVNILKYYQLHSAIRWILFFISILTYMPG